MIKDLQPGQYIFTWHDAGCMGMQHSYFRVARVSPYFIWLVWEHEQDHSFRKKREWVEANFGYVPISEWHPKIKLP